jgi:hypothetical protein
MDLYENRSENSLKGDPSNDTTVNPPLFSLVNTFNHLESGKNESSSETQLQSSKTSRGSYLDPELYIFVKYFNSI